MLSICQVADKMATTPRRRARNELTLKTKIALINDSPGKSHRQLANMYNIGRSQVATILKNKHRFIEAFENKRLCLERKRPSVRPTYDEVDSVTWRWFLHMRSVHLPVSSSMVQEQARKFAIEMGQLNFKASNSWLKRFKQRHDIDCIGKPSANEVDAAADTEKKYIPLVQLMKHAVREPQLDEPTTNGGEMSEASVQSNHREENHEHKTESDVCSERGCSSSDEVVEEEEEEDIKPVVPPSAIKTVAEAQKVIQDLKVFASVHRLDTVYHHAAQIETELEKCL